MHDDKIAVIFAGQGVLERVPDRAPSRLAIPARFATHRRQAPAARQPGHPWALDSMIYKASIAAYRRLQDAGLQPHALVGHGFGEIAAVVAAGAFAVSEGAEIVSARWNAL